MTELQADARQARMALRRFARQLLQNPTDAKRHLDHLRAALALPGSEPVQGALADIFVSFGAQEVTLKRTALQIARPRLAVHTGHWFDAHVNLDSLPRITSLATRWSVLARPSTDISTRARRCSVDDSRALAEQVVHAVENANQQAQQEFLHHCVTCHDNLAFMLARRALLRAGATLPPDWEAVSLQLEQSREFT